jgi:hypothetical protein
VRQLIDKAAVPLFSAPEPARSVPRPDSPPLTNRLFQAPNFEAPNFEAPDFELPELDGTDGVVADGGTETAGAQATAADHRRARTSTDRPRDNPRTRASTAEGPRDRSPADNPLARASTADGSRDGSRAQASADNQRPPAARRRARRRRS